MNVPEAWNLAKRLTRQSIDSCPAIISLLVARPLVFCDTKATVRFCLSESSLFQRSDFGKLVMQRPQIFRGYPDRSRRHGSVGSLGLKRIFEQHLEREKL